jgi:hypothetical protein
MAIPGATALNGEPLMHCGLLPAALKPWVRRLIVGLCVSIGALLVALAATAGIAAWQRATWRPRVARRAALMVKRARGPPRGEGRVTAVVTDIEGYSGGSWRGTWHPCRCAHGFGCRSTRQPGRPRGPGAAWRAPWCRVHAHYTHRIKTLVEIPVKAPVKRPVKTPKPRPADLMKLVPEAMTRALAIHNQIMRRAAHANAGSVFGQEGDSYT